MEKVQRRVSKPTKHVLGRRLALAPFEKQREDLNCTLVFLVDRL